VMDRYWPSPRAAAHAQIGTPLPFCPALVPIAGARLMRALSGLAQVLQDRHRSHAGRSYPQQAPPDSRVLSAETIADDRPRPADLLALRGTRFDAMLAACDLETPRGRKDTARLRLLPSQPLPGLESRKGIVGHRARCPTPSRSSRPISRPGLRSPNAKRRPPSPAASNRARAPALPLSVASASLPHLLSPGSALTVDALWR